MKLPTTAAAIASRQFTPRQRLNVSPAQRIGGASFVATRDRTQVRLGFQAAIAHPGSLSDAFFEQVAVSVGGPALVAWGQKFGIGRRSGIELTQDEPDSSNQGHDVWNALARQEDWYVGNTTQLALGQGALTVSPLQAAIMLSVPANGGYRVQPHLVADRSAAAAREHLHLSPRTLTLMQQALVDSAAANSHLTATATLPVAGQGGVIRRENGQTIAWFGAYAPIDQPAAVVVAVVENPDNRDHAERTVRQTLAAYLDPQGIPSPSSEIPVSIP
jgi:penicillin-binding protein 2